MRDRRDNTTSSHDNDHHGPIGRATAGMSKKRIANKLDQISTVVNKKDPDLPLTDEQIEQEQRERENRQHEKELSMETETKQKDLFEMNQFYQDHDRIGKELKTLEGSIEELKRHNQLLLDCTDEDEQKKEEHQINVLVESVGKRSTSIRQEIEDIMARTEEMKKNAPKGSGDIRIRKSKTALLMKHFAEIVQKFHQVDTKARKDHQGLVERQYKTSMFPRMIPIDCMLKIC